MDINFQNLGPEKWHGDCLIMPLCEDMEALKQCPDLDIMAPWLTVAPALRDVSGRVGEISMVHGHPELGISRILFVGLGKCDNVDSIIFRKAVGQAVQYCRDRGYATLVMPVTALDGLAGGRERLVEEAAYSAIVSLYRFSSMKTPDSKEMTSEIKEPQWLAFAMPASSCRDACDSVQMAGRRGERAGNATILARELATKPGNLLYPEVLADQALEIADKTGLACKVLDEKDLAEQGMGAMLAVGQGSVHPPRLVVLEYWPKGVSADAQPLILIGKGITFDSGGISLKPATNMHQMKGDMSGAAAVLACMSQISCETNVGPVVGILACAENLPGGRASRPGDVVRTMNGQTVEITNTDAEGRLVLCDALAYAQKYFDPSAIVDIATLTGACSVALGTELAGIFATEDSLAEAIISCGGTCGENFWRLPLWPGYAENLKSEIADICHTGPREGGAINAAMFLKHFVDKNCPWAHLDIAGVDWNAKKNSLCQVGPTGFGARTLLELARGFKTGKNI